MSKRALQWVLVLLFLCSALCALAQEHHSRVRLPGGEMTYGELFTLIESQTPVWFGYSPQDVDVKQTVTLPRGEMELGPLLDWLFDGTTYKYRISERHVLISRGEGQPVAVRTAVDHAPVVYTSYQNRKPNIALKSNLLYDATTTINLGVEIGLGRKWTLDVPVNVNFLKNMGDTRLRHWGVQPEARYWFCERFDGWFVGLHAHYARFNVGGLPDWGIFSKNMQTNRYQGYLYGAGVSIGYAWILKNRWSMEATVGLGYARIHADKYPCADCGTAIDKGGKNYFGPTKVGLSLIYVIK